ncbi:MAG: carboxypeptidase-like regulatory domain-containing protein [Planctomycetota bacterium]
MQRSAVVVLVLSAVLAAAVAAVLWGGGEPVLPTPGGQTPGGQTPGGPTVGESPQPAPQGQDPVVRPPIELAADAPRVTLAVTSRERFAPPPSCAVTAVLADGTPLATATIAGAGAGFDAPPAARGAALVAIGLGEGDLLRQVGLGPDAPPYVVGARIVLRGRVLAADQRPVAGARVWFGERHQDGALREVVTDIDGNFEGDVPAGTGVPFVVRGDGFASQWRPIVVDHTGGELLATLQPGCELQIQLAAMATDMSGARAFVVPEGAVSSELSQWPFFLAALDGPDGGGAPFEARGEARIAGLPRVGTVGVVVVHPFAPIEPPKAVTLKGERVMAMVPLRFAAGRQLGAVVDEQREPLVGARLWLHARGATLADAGSSRLLPPHLTLRGACAARSGDGGAFELGVPDGELVLSVRARGFAGRDVEPTTVANAPLMLPRWHGGDASLRLLPPGDTAWHVDTDLGGGLQQDLPAGEAFVVALPHAGVFDVVLTVTVAGQVRAHRDDLGLLVTGPIELRAPQPE